MKTKTATTTRTLTRTEVKRLIASGTLSREEELVLRMRYGVAAPASEPLEMRHGGDPEMQARLAALEKATYERLQQSGQAELRNRNRERILDTLKKLQ